MISHLGTFDVENYGDLLYPIVFGRLVNKHGFGQVRQYSPLPTTAPQEAGFETDSISTLFAQTAAPHNVIIGGGDLLRADWNVFASHYSANSHGSYRSLRRSIGPVKALSYLVRTKVPRGEPATFFTTRFRARWLNYANAGPFLIDSERLPRGSTVSYLSCGVPHEFTHAERESVRRTLNQSRFIYLRDEQSAEKLRRAGVEREIHVAPDLAITLSDQFDKKEQRRRGREIVSTLGIDPESSFLCFQCKPYPDFREDEIVEQLKRYHERTKRAVVLLPIGHCHGDAPFLKGLAHRSSGSLKYADIYSVADIMSVIAASDMFIGTSLHGNVTASSYGIPHLFGPLPVDKTAGFLDVMNLPAELLLRSWTEMNEKIDFAIELGHEFFSKRAALGKAKVYRVVEEMLRSND